MTAERVSAAAYGTVLILAALPLVDAEEVVSGVGWELAVGVGLATWLAHLFAEVVGDHVRHTAAAHERAEIARAMVDGLPILVASVPPATALLLGRVGVTDGRTALWVAVAIAVVQLVGLGAYVGAIVTEHPSGRWVYAAATTAFGVLVVAIKVVLHH